MYNNFFHFISLGLAWFASLPLGHVHSPSSLLAAYPTGFPINSLMEVDLGYLNELICIMLNASMNVLGEISNIFSKTFLKMKMTSEVYLFSFIGASSSHINVIIK